MPRDAPDMNGVSHTVEITSAAFYEAVSPCPAATNRLPESPRGSNAVKVSVADVCVEHEVKTMDFTKWFEARILRAEAGFLSALARKRSICAQSTTRGFSFFMRTYERNALIAPDVFEESIFPSAARVEFSTR